MKMSTGILLATVALCVSTLATAAPLFCPKNPVCSVVLDGRVTSGAGLNALPIGGAEVTIYQTQAKSTDALAAAMSDADGKFSVALPVDGSEGIRYAVARKGKAVELVAVIGTVTPPAITVNEMTTVAGAYAMAQFFKKGEIAGKSMPLQVAAGMAQNLASVAAGTFSPSIAQSPNGDETNAWRLLGTLANILAACVRDTSAACATLFTLTSAAKGPKTTTTLEAALNIVHNPTTNVKEIFALGDAVKPFVPYLLPQHGPDSSFEELRLDGFTLAVKVNATGRINTNGDEECPFGGPGNIAFDQNGYAWITNNVVQGTPASTNCFVVLKPNGQPADGIGGTPSSPITGGGILGQGFGIGIDPLGNLWAGNFGWGGVIPDGSVSQFTSQGAALSPSAGYTDGTVDGLNRVQGTTSDLKGNIWMASSASDSVHVFPNGNPYSGYPVYRDANTSPFHIVVDDDGFGWVSYTGTSALSNFAFSSTGLVRQFTVTLGSDSRPKGIALDSRGNAWIAAGAASLIYAVSNKGKMLGGFGGGGVLGPWGLAVDSDDNVWVANFGPEAQITTKYRVSRLCGVSTNNCPPGTKMGDPISPATGYTLPSGGEQVRLESGEPLYGPLGVPSFKPLMRATAAHVDMAGNVWITNNWKPSGVNDIALNPGGDGIVIFVGIAAPVKPTFTGQPKAP